MGATHPRDGTEPGRAGPLRTEGPRLVLGPALAAALLLAAAQPWPTLGGELRAQEDGLAREKVPQVMSGVPVVLLPVQAIRPTAGGAWPGGARSREAALEALNSELDFALREVPAASAWTAPGETVERARRNPMLKVDPRRLSYRGLMGSEEHLKDEIYSPLHGQLRRLTALFDTRLVVLPVMAWYQRGALPADTTAQDTAPAGEAGGGRKRPPSPDDPSGGAAPDDAADGAPGADAGGGGVAEARGRRAQEGRVLLLVAIIDTRGNRLVWRGRVASQPAPPDSPALFATVAARLVDALVPS